MSSIDYLQQWFGEQCNTSWEHEFGIKIETIDNPGWSVRIQLNQTDFYDKNFDIVDIVRDESDWIYCEKRDGTFFGYGGTNNLKEIIEQFSVFLDHDSN